MRTIIAIFVFWGLSVINGYAKTLEYNVYYGPILLGTVVWDESKFIINSDTTYRISAIVQSIPKIFLLKYYGSFVSTIRSDGKPLHFTSIEWTGGDTTYSEVDFNNEMSQYHVVDRKANIIRTWDKTMEESTYDGLSAIRTVRKNVFHSGIYTIFSFYDDNHGPIKVENTDEYETEFVPAMQKTMSLRCVRGDIKIRAMAGWSGGYEAWISTDDDPLFIHAKSKILIGSIRLELVSVR